VEDDDHEEEGEVEDEDVWDADRQRQLSGWGPMGQGSLGLLVR
jgi:hypothetical protein